MITNIVILNIVIVCDIITDVLLFHPLLVCIYLTLQYFSIQAQTQEKSIAAKVSCQ